MNDVRVASITMSIAVLLLGSVEIFSIDQEQITSSMKPTAFMTNLAAMRSVAPAKLEEYNGAPSALPVASGGAQGAAGVQGNPGLNGVPGNFAHSFISIIEESVVVGALIPIDVLGYQGFVVNEDNTLTVSVDGYYLINYSASFSDESSVNGQYFEVALNDGCMLDSVTYNGIWSGIKFLPAGSTIGLRNISNCPLSNLSGTFTVIQINSTTNIG